jgi:hypothetical protein
LFRGRAPLSRLNLPSWRSWDERVCYQVEKVTEQPPEIGPAFEL